ncbi:hypothetical protein MUK70_29835 [Dyadobacter chenwenxiniae]|uniref:Por secretion system C-terminal sorting domain-containing protein n=1 Tax=Dyadobacter chenwenxiniae TaxID=2906456 RepID=A0A9X1TFZ6_9BACT|nr:hypothetical protein [Dyadobacter chenwenxiniae]MCF0063522.1 hypothetical protein [Dyadobacter chenwenxiniae]UON83201.1 hypothetical protein MUK70_29835 [Dyadobacter chenwenxiniae]
MKTSIRTFALVIAFVASFAFNTFADEKENKKVVGFGTGIFVSKSHKLFVSVDKYNDSNAILTLTDKSGKAIYHETLNRKVDKIRKILDINTLPAGNYTIEIFSNGERYSKTIEVAEQFTQRAISLR